MNNVTQVVWIDEKISGHYIWNLNNYVLNPKHLRNVTEATWNKEVLSEIVNKPQELYRPMIVFEFDETKPFQKCFSMSHFKANPNKLEEFQIGNFGHIKLNTSIDVPTEYLKVLNYTMEKNNIKKSSSLNTTEKKSVLTWLSLNEIEFTMIKKQTKKILELYDVISLRKLTDDIHTNELIKAANLHMINNKKVHEFCLSECEKIKIFPDWKAKNLEKFQSENIAFKKYCEEFNLNKVNSSDEQSIDSVDLRNK